MCLSAKEKLGLWIEVSVCAAHTATAQAQMGAGCCLGSSLEEHAHTSAYLFLRSLVASLLATASQKNPQCSTSGRRRGSGGPRFSPCLSSPSPTLSISRGPGDQTFPVIYKDAPTPLLATQQSRAGHSPEPPCPLSHLWSPRPVVPLFRGPVGLVCPQTPSFLHFGFGGSQTQDLLLRNLRPKSCCVPRAAVLLLSNGPSL